jgi:hypothetical protein
MNYGMHEVGPSRSDVLVRDPHLGHGDPHRQTHLKNHPKIGLEITPRYRPE